MKRVNEDQSPAETVIRANGLYEGYARFLQEALLLDELNGDQLKAMYVFDRHHSAKPRYTPGRGWQELELVRDPEMERNFQVPPAFGEYEREFLVWLSVRRPAKVLRVIGEMGTGKSTFLKYMLLEFLPTQPFFSSGVLLWLDFNRLVRFYDANCDPPEIEEELKGEIVKHVKGSLVKTDNDRLWTRISTFDDLMTSLEESVKAVGGHRTVVCFDNLDVFPPRFQHALSNLTVALAHRTGASFVLALRNLNARYYEACANSGTLLPSCLYHQPPKLGSIVAARFSAMSCTDPDLLEERVLRIMGELVTLEEADFEVFRAALVKWLRHDLQDDLASLTNHNLRVGLFWILRIVQSWNLNVVNMTPRLRARFASQVHLNAPPLTFEAFVAAIGLCNHSVFCPAFSCLENVFSANGKNENGDLLVKYRALRFCGASSESVSRQAIESHLVAFGYSAGLVAEAVGQLLLSPKRLLRSEDGDKYQDVQSVKLNFAGRYYLHKLICNMEYLQVVADDCYLPEEVAEALRPHSDVSQRFIGLARLIKYIGETEAAETFNVRSRRRDWFEVEFRRVYDSQLLALKLIASLSAKAEGVFHALSMARRPVASAEAVLKEIESTSIMLGNLNDRLRGA